MSPTIETGPIPTELDLRLQRRESSPLPAGALLRFQQISRGKSNRNNYLWLLMEDGRCFLARNQSNLDWQLPMDRPLPDEVTGILASNELEEIKAKLAAANLAELDPYHLDKGVKGGNYYAITTPEHHIIFAGVENELTDLLRDTVYQCELTANNSEEHNNDAGSWLSRLLSRLR